MQAISYVSPYARKRKLGPRIGHAMESLEHRVFLSTTVFSEGVNGYVGTQDTYVRLDNPTAAFGNATAVTVDLDDNGASGNQPVQGLIRFDDLFGSAVGQIPAGATITSAVLTLYTGASSGDSSSTSTSLYRMLTSWNESSTWNSLSGGISANGTEAAAVADGTVTPSVLGAAVTFNVTATVQAWVNNSAANFGWALLANGTNGWWWNSSEASNSTLRPALTINYTTSPGTNQPPVVNAGPDQTITLPAAAALDGTASDDGLPSGSVTTLWSKVSGSGTVTFANGNAVDTTASFSTSGTYVLRLTANDGSLSSSDDITIVVNPAPSGGLLQPVQLSQDTLHKPQSKLWEHAGTWWGVFPNSSGTWVWRLDGDQWTAVLKIDSSTGTRADTLHVGNVTHVLLFNGTSSKLASVEYVAGSPGTYRLWSVRPELASVSLSSGVEAATIAMDGAGRMWLASDASSTIQVRYSDYPYRTWSSSITLASGVTSDDICVITSMPNGSVAILWSNQNTERFGFRTHAAGASPTTWTADELPASQSALNVGAGMADDHMNVKVGSDGTLYAAVKTGYDTSGYPKIALLIRRPNGNWDNLYSVDTSGTRAIVVLNEAVGRLRVIYSAQESGANIVYRETSLSSISFGPRTTLLSGTLNNATSTRDRVSDDLVVVAGNPNTKVLYGIRVVWPGVSTTTLSSADANEQLLMSTNPSDEEDAGVLLGKATGDSLFPRTRGTIRDLLLDRTPGDAAYM